jgi:hypothetical protein
MTLLTAIGREEAFIDTLLGRFRARFENERAFSLRYRVLRLVSDEGIPLDVALGAIPFEERSIGRATPWFGSGPATHLITCTAEDLIVHKAFANRDRDWLDITAVVARQGRKLNSAQIWSELQPLADLKEEPEILTRLQRIWDEQID